eukprot:848464-Rhodomonas_salina.2
MDEEALEALSQAATQPAHHGMSEIPLEGTGELTDIDKLKELADSGLRQARDNSGKSRDNSGKPRDEPGGIRDIGLNDMLARDNSHESRVRESKQLQKRPKN